MRRFLQNGPVGKAVELFHRIRSLHITTYSGYASFFIVLAVFPALVLILGLLRHTALEPEDLLDMMEGFLPGVLRGYAWNLIADCYANTSRTLVSVSALTALWSAGKGIYGLMKGMNAVYGVENHRGWLQTRLLCAVYMVLLLLVLLLTLILRVFGTTLVIYLQHRGGKLNWLATQLLGLRYFLLVAVQTALFTALFMYLPGRNNGFRESLPGALFSSFGWMMVSGIFSIYVEKFSGYSTTYGSMGAGVLAMLWLYFCVNTLFFGGVLNRYLKKNVDFS